MTGDRGVILQYVTLLNKGLARLTDARRVAMARAERRAAVAAVRGSVLAAAGAGEPLRMETLVQRARAAVLAHCHTPDIGALRPGEVSAAHTHLRRLVLALWDAYANVAHGYLREAAAVPSSKRRRRRGADAGAPLPFAQCIGALLLTLREGVSVRRGAVGRTRDPPVVLVEPDPVAAALVGRVEVLEQSGIGYNKRAYAAIAGAFRDALTRPVTDPSDAAAWARVAARLRLDRAAALAGDHWIVERLALFPF